MCRDLWAVLDLAVSPLGCFGCVRSLSAAAPGHFLLGWSGSVYLQPGSLSGRSGAAAPRTSSFLLKTVWARDPGQRNLGWWGCWSPVEREQPHHLPQLRPTAEPIERSLLYALLFPCPPCLSWLSLASGVLVNVNKNSLKKRYLHRYLCISLCFLFLPVALRVGTRSDLPLSFRAWRWGSMRQGHMLSQSSPPRPQRPSVTWPSCARPPPLHCALQPALSATWKL